MKTCQCCAVEAPADAATCANCGEASWFTALSLASGASTKAPAKKSAPKPAPTES